MQAIKLEIIQHKKKKREERKRIQLQQTNIYKTKQKTTKNSHNNKTIFK